MMEKLIKKLNNRKGFTLIELIVVIAIIGILAAILIPQFTGFQQKAKSTQMTVEAKQIATAADSLLIENAAAAVNNASVAALAGPDITASHITTMSAVGGHVTFSYTKTLDDGKTYTAVRGSDGKITVTY